MGAGGSEGQHGRPGPATVPKTETSWQLWQGLGILGTPVAQDAIEGLVQGWSPKTAR